MSHTAVRPVRSMSWLRLSIEGPLDQEDSDGLRGHLKRGPPEESTDNSDGAQAKHLRLSIEGPLDQKDSDDSRGHLTRGPSDESTDDPDGAQAKHPNGSSDAGSLPASTASTRPMRRLRDLYEQIVPFRYPGYEPRNDFELLTLGGGDYSFVQEGGLDTFLAEELSAFVDELGGNRDIFMDKVRHSLDELVEVIGEKPLPGQADVEIILIPNSQYSLRLWPGSFSEREFCLDYVLADDTNKAVNRPPGYELTSHIPTPLPWLGMGGQPLDSLEANFGIPDEDIRPGEEKFIVSDGVTCTLEYPERSAGSEVRFSIPVRASM